MGGERSLPRIISHDDGLFFELEKDFRRRPFYPDLAEDQLQRSVRLEKSTE